MTASSQVEAALIGVTGSLLVLSLNWLWSRYVEQRSRKRVRAMLRIEIDENLQGLSKWWHGTEAAVTFSRSPLAGVQQLDAAKKLPLPVRNHRVWQAALPLIPMSLD